MNLKSTLISGLAALSMGALTLAPVSALAQGRHHHDNDKNEWKNIAIGAGAVGLVGALTHDKTLAFAGAAGALYSLDRYNQDRNDSGRNHLRSEYFSRPYFYRDDVRYDRRTVNKRGKQYYQFVRHGG